MSRPRVEKAAGVTDILTIVGTVMTGIGGLLLSVAQVLGGGSKSF